MKKGKKQSFSRHMRERKPCVKCGSKDMEPCKATDGRCPGLPDWLAPTTSEKP